MSQGSEDKRIWLERQFIDEVVWTISFIDVVVWTISFVVVELAFLKALLLGRDLREDLMRLAREDFPASAPIRAAMEEAAEIARSELAKNTTGELTKKDVGLALLDVLYTWHPGNVPKWIATGELTGKEAVKALADVICIHCEVFDLFNGKRGVKLYVALCDEWILARGRKGVRWNDTLYPSGHEAALETLHCVADVLNDPKWWETEPLDAAGLYTALKGITGGADELDLVAYVEQEAAFMREAAREGARQQPGHQNAPLCDDSAYRNASEFIDGIRFKNLSAVTRFLGAHPEIRTLKPSPKRLTIHSGDMMAALKAETDIALAADRALSKQTQAYLRIGRQNDRREARQ